MERNNLNRLTHVMISFAGLILVQRAARFLLFRFAPGLGTLGDFLVFLDSDDCYRPAYLLAFGAAFALLRLPLKTVEEEDPVPELVKKKTGRCVLHLLASVAALVTLMFLVAAFMNGEEAFSGGVSAAGEMPSLDPLSVASLLLIHPVAEEVLFRRLYYGELRRMHPVFGCMAQALMFALAHESVDGMIYAKAGAA